MDPWAFGPGLWNVAALLFAVSGVTMAAVGRGRYRNRVIGVAVLRACCCSSSSNVVGQMLGAAGRGR